MKYLHFFATKSDLETLLDTLERGVSVKYVSCMRWLDGPGDVAYERGRNLPRLGHATIESAVAGDAYLVVPKEESVFVQAVDLLDGTKRHLVDQLGNPKSVVFSPGGLWGDDVLLNGRFATVSDDAEAQTIMRCAAKALRKEFKRIRAFWVGPAAEGCLDAASV